MMMDDVCIDLINQGVKKETRRIKRNNKRPGVPGHIHLVKKDRTKNVYGKILIIDVYVEDNIYVVDEKHANNEGFNNRKEFIEYWLNVNHGYNNEEIWVVEFIPLDQEEMSEKVAKAISKTYLKKYKNMNFKEYLSKCVHITTEAEIAATNDKYQKIIKELCESGEAIYIEEGDNIIFLNWDFCYKVLFRNFAIVW